MSGTPWMKFYPSDWMGDQALARASLATRGLWMHLLCMMHQNAAERGVLPETPDGEAVEVSRGAGCSVEDAERGIAELIARGIASRVPESGRLCSRRMLRDEDLRSKRSAAGRAGGLAGRLPDDLLKQNGKQEGEQNVVSGLCASLSGSQGESEGGDASPAPSENVAHRPPRRRSAASAAEVASRPEFAAFLQHTQAQAAWEAWLEWVGTAGAKQDRCMGRQAAAILNRAVREGPSRFAEAVDYAIGGNYLQPTYRDRGGVNGREAGSARSGGDRAADELREIRERAMSGAGDADAKRLFGGL